jgi:hypothetical protein
MNENLEITEFTEGNSAKNYTAKTDKLGNFQFPKSLDDNYYRYYLVKNGNNVVMIDVYGNNRYNRKQSENQETAQIFLDRKIYRPGQIVYFKVIATGINGETQKVKTLEKGSVEYYNSRCQW